jgi:hypothetical protein
LVLEVCEPFQCLRASGGQKVGIQTNSESITYIILADVYAFGSNRNRDVDAIVDDQRNIVSFSDPVKLLGCLNQFGRVGCFIPVLNYCGT